MARAATSLPIVANGGLRTGINAAKALAVIVADLLAARVGRHRTFWGVWLLTACDLVLDPAMAAPSLRVQFWTWHEIGSYFSMPLQNLLRWSLTGLVYMGISRLLWGSDIDVATVAPVASFPFVVLRPPRASSALMTGGWGRPAPLGRP